MVNAHKPPWIFLLTRCEIRLCFCLPVSIAISPCKATNLTARCHRKQSLLILFTGQSYKSYCMVSPQTVSTYPFHYAKLQILLHGVTANSLYLIIFTVQSYKSYYMVSPQTVSTYPFHRAKLQILLHGVTANNLYLSFSPCKATNLTTRCHRKQSLLNPFHRAKLQILLHGVTANSLYLFLLCWFICAFLFCMLLATLRLEYIQKNRLTHLHKL